MFVSIILPVRNEAPFIEETLRAALAQDYPRDLLEVIVVDGMSEDGTRAIVQRLAEGDARLRMLDNPQRITPAALNLGIRAARGEVIVRVDGHGVIPPNYVRECVALLTETGRDRSPSEPSGSATPSLTDAPTSRRADPPQHRSTETPPSPLSAFSFQLSAFEERPPSSVHRPPSSVLLAVGGAWDCVGRGIVGAAIALATSSRFGVGGSRYRTTGPWANPRTHVRGYEREPVQTDTVPFWAMRRAVFEQLGLFREEMLCHEDYEFNHRLRQAGGTILLLPWLRSKYHVRSTLGAVCRQYGRYGFWKGRFLRSHPESLKTRHLIPPLFVAALAVAAIAASVTVAGRVALGILVATYLCFLVIATVTILLPRSREHEFADSQSSVAASRASADSQSSVAASRQSADSPIPQSAIGNRESGIEHPASGIQNPESQLPSSVLRPPPPASPFALCALLPVVLATVHLTWGVGVWLGLLRGKVPGEPPRL